MSGPSSKEGMDNMSTTAEKTCIDCGKPYRPMSNVQKRCTECRVKMKNAKRCSKKPSTEKSPSYLLKADGHDHRISLDLSPYPKMFRYLTSYPNTDPGELFLVLFRAKNFEDLLS